MLHAMWEGSGHTAGERRTERLEKNPRLEKMPGERARFDSGDSAALAAASDSSEPEAAPPDAPGSSSSSGIAHEFGRVGGSARGGLSFRLGATPRDSS